MKANDLNQSNFNVFIGIIRKAFLGLPFDYKNGTFKLKATMVSPYDFLRKIEKPKSEYEKLLVELEKDFKVNARTEMYRRERGWITRGVSQKAIKKLDVDGKTLLIPILSSPAVGIDTSGFDDSLVIVFSFLDNFGAGTVFLEKHLGVPKAKNPIEYKWNKLDSRNRKKVYESLKLLLSISCCGLLVIHTNVLVSPVGSLIYGFRDLIEGCFSGYEKMPSQPRELRESLRQRLFSMCNNTPVHCDADFRPLSPDKIVRFLVRTLSKKDGKIQDCTPLYAPLKSEESQPIQIADIIAGVTGMRIRNNEKPPAPLFHLFFDNRKINSKARKKGKFAKAYCWFKSE